MMTPGRVPLDFPALARPVALALLGKPNPRMSTAAELRYGNRGSLQVTIAGEWAGRWCDHESGEAGGVLDLVIHEHRASDRAGAVRWLDAEGFTDPVRGRESASTACPEMTACGSGEGRRTAYRHSAQASRRGSARRLWESTRSIVGTVAAAYLESRGVAHMAGALALRFHPGIAHPNAPGRFPALVAGVQDAGGQFMGIQRCYLDGARKASVDPVRASLGSLAGGAVRLGERVTNRVLVGEGIESTGAAMRTLDVPAALATLGTSGLRAVVLPATVRRAVIAADRDPGGLRAAAALAERLEAEGRRVTIEAPPSGDFADWQGESA